MTSLVIHMTSWFWIFSFQWHRTVQNSLQIWLDHWGSLVDNPKPTCRTKYFQFSVSWWLLSRTSILWPKWCRKLLYLHLGFDHLARPGLHHEYSLKKLSLLYSINILLVNCWITYQCSWISDNLRASVLAVVGVSKAILKISDYQLTRLCWMYKIFIKLNYRFAE